jgi:hypothetical protein
MRNKRNVAIQRYFKNDTPLIIHPHFFTKLYHLLKDLVALWENKKVNKKI